MGALAGSFTPVGGSVFFGQANLLVLVPLALAWRNRRTERLDWRCDCHQALSGGRPTGLVARRRDGLMPALVGLGLASALIAIPNLVIRQSGGGTLFRLHAPDTYLTNESFNGALSRLASSKEVLARHFPDCPLSR